MEHNLPHHLVEDYLLGKLSAADQARLEQQLLHDTQLQEELDLQRDVIDGLREARRNELKARLDGIPVNTGLVTAPLAKIASGLAVVATVVFTAYYFTSSNTNTASVLVTELSLPAEAEVTSEIPALPQPTALPVAQLKEDTEQVTAVEPKAESQLLRSPKISKAGPAIAAERAEQSYTIAKPSLVNFSETELATAAIGDKPVTDVFGNQNKFTRQPLEVSAQQDIDYNFHYQFNSGKLYIYGDFAQQPYEVLEINCNNSSQYYLYYQNSYYSLKQNQKRIAPLRKINDKSLLKELEITRLSK